MKTTLRNENFWCFRNWIFVPPWLTKTRFSGRVTVLGSKSRAVLESAQNFEEDEVVFVLGTPIFGPIFPKSAKIFQKNPFLTKIFFFSFKIEMFTGGSKNKIWDILGHFGHNWALKKGREKEVYCRFWGLVDHCVLLENLGNSVANLGIS